MRMEPLLLIVALAAPSLIRAQDNPVLAALKNADQEARQEQETDWQALTKHDAERRQAVLAMLKAKDIRTAQDYYNAALIFQHGQTPDDIRLAHALATLSATLADDPSEANWLRAASWDRLMALLNQPQWYGTQFVQDASGTWTLYELQPGAVTDEQRAAWSVPSLQAAQERTESMNADR